MNTLALLIAFSIPVSLFILAMWLLYKEKKQLQIKSGDRAVNETTEEKKMKLRIPGYHEDIIHRQNKNLKDVINYLSDGGIGI